MREIQPNSANVQTVCTCTSTRRPRGACGTCADQAHEQHEGWWRALANGAPDDTLIETTSLHRLNDAIAARVGQNLLRDLLGDVLVQLPGVRP